jgi:2-keto-4-pentenoate hydratase/2-oxohepta-3-ene-1,7-dioic acid hydratase in catechol pathway
LSAQGVASLNDINLRELQTRALTDNNNKALTSNKISSRKTSDPLGPTKQRLDTAQDFIFWISPRA